MRRPQKHLNLLSKIRQCIEEGKYIEAVHVQFRKHQRRIILSDILQVLMTGYHESRKDQFDTDYRAWNYAICGHAKDTPKMRVIVSFNEEESLLIITAFYVEDVQ